MDLSDTVRWPFFDDGHRRFAAALARWADAAVASLPRDEDAGVDAACRARVKALGEAEFLKAAVPADHGGLHPRLDVRTLCLARRCFRRCGQRRRSDRQSRHSKSTSWCRR